MKVPARLRRVPWQAGAFVLALAYIGLLGWQDMTLKAANDHLIASLQTNAAEVAHNRARINIILHWIDPHNSYRASVDKLLAIHYAGDDQVGQEIRRMDHSLTLLAVRLTKPCR